MIDSGQTNTVSFGLLCIWEVGLKPILIRAASAFSRSSRFFSPILISTFGNWPSRLQVSWSLDCTVPGRILPRTIVQMARSWKFHRCMSNHFLRISCTATLSTRGFTRSLRAWPRSSRSTSCFSHCAALWNSCRRVSTCFGNYSIRIQMNCRTTRTVFSSVEISVLSGGVPRLSVSCKSRWRCFSKVLNGANAFRPLHCRGNPSPRCCFTHRCGPLDKLHS